MNAKPAATAKQSLRLGDVAIARSGDKGNHVNLGVIAFSPEGYQYLVRELTCSRIQNFFGGLGIDRLERFELPNLNALNFVLYNALAGGASRSLRLDTQGKLLGTALLELPLPMPENGQALAGTGHEVRPIAKPHGKSS